jgi:hypothetical protein
MPYSLNFEASPVVDQLKRDYRTGKINSVQFAHAIMDAWARFNGAMG